MDEQVQHALDHDYLIDITTGGRKTEQPRRIEIRFHNIEGHLYITGRPPRPRDWYANLLTHPEFTFHLKQSVRIDLPAGESHSGSSQVPRNPHEIHQKWAESRHRGVGRKQSPVAVELLVN